MWGVRRPKSDNSKDTKWPRKWPLSAAWLPVKRRRGFQSNAERRAIHAFFKRCESKSPWGGKVHRKISKQQYHCGRQALSQGGGGLTDESHSKHAKHHRLFPPHKGFSFNFRKLQNSQQDPEKNTIWVYALQFAHRRYSSLFNMINFKLYTVCGMGVFRGK